MTGYGDGSGLHQGAIANEKLKSYIGVFFQLLPFFFSCDCEIVTFWLEKEYKSAL